LTQREEDNRVRRGKAAAKGATVIFWRFGGGAVDELLALRVLLFDLVAIFLLKILLEDFVAGPRIQFGRKMDNDGRRIDAEFNSNSTRHYLKTLHCGAQGH
jgi:hypothetical protein